MHSGQQDRSFSAVRSTAHIYPMYIHKLHIQINLQYIERALYSIYLGTIPHVVIENGEIEVVVR